MKAIAWTAYGAPEVLKLQEFKQPLPKSHEVLIKVHASTVTAGDVRLRALQVPRGFQRLTRLAFGLTKPRKPIIGMDFSGEVALVGDKVTLFKKGDKVFGSTGVKLGANAEYICLSQHAAFINKPTNVGHEQAAATVFGGMTAIHFLTRSVTLQRGQKILINGASGAVGTAAIQLAKYFGAEVTGVCSASNAELIQSLGVDGVIDYAKTDLYQGSASYDIILDAVGNMSLPQCKNLLTAQGKLISINADLSTLLSSVFQRKQVCGAAPESKQNLTFLKERIEAGEFKAVIDTTYPLAQTAEAHAYVDTGRKKGNVVIAVASKDA